MEKRISVILGIVMILWMIFITVLCLDSKSATNIEENKTTFHLVGKTTIFVDEEGKWVLRIDDSLVVEDEIDESQ